MPKVNRNFLTTVFLKVLIKLNYHCLHDLPTRYSYYDSYDYGRGNIHINANCVSTMMKQCIIVNYYNYYTSLFNAPSYFTM